MPHTFPLLYRGFSALWLAGFLYLALEGATVAPPGNIALWALVSLGFIYFLAFEQDPLRRLLRDHRALLTVVLLLALAILLSEGLGKLRGEAPAHPLPAQPGLLLCLPILALFLRDEGNFRGVVVLCALVSAWHLVAMPLEAILGLKLSWHPVMLLPRDAGPLHYQASGLAWQAYYFPGLLLPLFYLAWGPVYERRVFPDWALSRKAMLALPVVWLVPAACVQSRSAFAGAMFAALLAIVASSRTRRLRTGLAGALLLVFAAAIYWHLFGENKSGAELRVAYLELYLREALDWRWIATGRSFYLDPDLRMMVQGLPPLQHSHNDIAQIFYSWGLPTLLAYLAFWFALLKLIYTRFVKPGEYWPACALMALLPNMVTDLGFQQYEKAAFLVLLTAFCMACAGRERPARGVAASLATPVPSGVRP